MNNSKIWSFSLALSFLFHSSVFAFFLINKKPNENFLDGINAQIGEFASVNFVANVPVGELKTISEERRNCRRKTKTHKKAKTREKTGKNSERKIRAKSSKHS